MHVKPTRKLSAIESIFVKEAEKSFFTVEFNDDGEPVATGADKNGHCFSMNVTEHPLGDGAAQYMIEN